MKRLIAAVLLLLASPAFAADAPRKVDFTTLLVVDGKPVIDDVKCPPDKDNKRPCDTPYTVGEIAFYSLERPQPNQSWQDGIKHDDLARAVRAAKDFPLLEDQKVTIEQAVGPMWAPSVLGAVRDVIDPRTPAVEK